MTRAFMSSRSMVAIGILLSIVATGASAQLSKPDYDRIPEILARMRSLEWQERSEALLSLIELGLQSEVAGRAHMFRTALMKLFSESPGSRETVTFALIGLLETENRFVAQHREPGSARLSEEYSFHYGNTIAAVAALSDHRSAEALLGAITTGGMATRTLADFGATVLSRVITRTDDADPLVRGATCHVLRQMVEPDNPRNLRSNSEAVVIIKETLLGMVADPNAMVRSAAAHALGALGDADAVPVLMHLAAADPATLPGPSDDGQPHLYPVRHAAKRALARIAQTRPQQ